MTLPKSLLLSRTLFFILLLVPISYPLSAPSAQSCTSKPCRPGTAAVLTSGGCRCQTCGHVSGFKRSFSTQPCTPCPSSCRHSCDPVNGQCLFQGDHQNTGLMDVLLPGILIPVIFAVLIPSIAIICYRRRKSAEISPTSVSEEEEEDPHPTGSPQISHPADALETTSLRPHEVQIPEQVSEETLHAVSTPLSSSSIYYQMNQGP